MRCFCLIAACLVSGASGCANPGIPKSPSLLLPTSVTDLAGSRVGNRVELHWTSPSRTTDGLDLTSPTTVEICRDIAQLPQPKVPTAQGGGVATSPPCTPILAVSGHPGEMTARAQLPANSLTPSGQPQGFAYRVRILNSAGRSAPPSAPILVPGGPSPAPVTGFHAAQQKAGVVLEWDRTSTPTPSTGEIGEVEVLRTLQTPPSGSSGVQKAKAPPAGKTSKSKKPNSPTATGRSADLTSVRLRQTRIPAPPQAQGQRPPSRDGMIDERALQGATYGYAAQRVMRVAAAGTVFEIRSEPTTTATLDIRNVFPPDPPEGLTGVPGMIGSSMGKAGTPAAIDLSWKPNTESDLAGYLVYRLDLEDAKLGRKPMRLTVDPIPGPSYADHQAVAGHRYAYVVTAVDHHGNESSASAPFQSTLASP